MRATRHGDDLIQLTSSKVINAWLVREDEGYTLIDTMSPGNATGILAAARELDAPISRILLTHAHFDHVGSLDAIVAGLGEGTPVAVSTRDARILAGDRSSDADEPGKLRGVWRTCTTTPTQLLEPGDRIGSLEVVAAPGHTPGHVAFLDSRTNTLLCGDAFIAVGGVASSGEFRARFPFSWIGTGDRPGARDTSRALAKLEPARLAPGHGPLVEPAMPAIAAALKRMD